MFVVSYRRINMESQITLISVRPISSPSSQNEGIWVFQANTFPSDSAQHAAWTPYLAEISSVLEQAFQSGADQTTIGDLYRIDFIELLQVCLEHPSQQRPIRRRLLKSALEVDARSEIDSARRERFSFPLSTTPHTSISVDTAYYGSRFVRDWVLKFTHGKLDVKFDAIFPALINGLKYEGRNEPENVVNNIVRDLNMVRDQTSKQKERQRIDKLQDCCVKLYTKQCYLCPAVNTALRDDDRTKLYTLGPYCYLLYNCVGRHTNHDLSMRHYLQKIIHPNESQSMIVYRGDNVSRKEINEYRQVAGRKDKYFTWLPFVSSSLERDVAESFGSNVLYIIELQRSLSNDQFTRLDKNSFIESEKEILLRSGVRFRVDTVEPDPISGRQLIKIKILPSYISNLR